MVVDRVYDSGLRADRADALQHPQAIAKQPPTDAQTSMGRSTEQPRTHTDSGSESALADLLAATPTGVPFLTGHLIIRRLHDQQTSALTGCGMDASRPAPLA
ncbi:hypothetical protein [Actinomadura rudentiformis]|uniref:Uncharacterized protein n=1 Tax=Actinomadura rudentiformis TaxID=359158 RepID=A0A6H9Z2I8_9ACTN|nr:hypothetical protein [Actinomadura rudentiformis]KAB2352242.1 hypothetical protein F8566_00595 [Actinomadura rudentiformis]